MPRKPLPTQTWLKAYVNFAWCITKEFSLVVRSNPNDKTKPPVDLGPVTKVSFTSRGEKRAGDPELEGFLKLSTRNGDFVMYQEMATVTAAVFAPFIPCDVMVPFVSGHLNRWELKDLVGTRILPILF